ncbi:Solanesyl diphosphate synthase 3, chloroplastic/mitochondrial [Vitis vinifera]|uniref:Solanesyl diphosphate synthase 3, chloroplastic/mitochondrial n=1 Tax=Vitis vinifera TaxID=29760 RepID=A0A438CIR8_VITVI|nr:Solanesyl diphosphate synthase 3, chloroplastic/mitochondrial [Vitis vinifera]
MVGFGMRKFQVLGCRETYSWGSPFLSGVRHQIHQESSSLAEHIEVDPPTIGFLKSEPLPQPSEDKYDLRNLGRPEKWLSSGIDWDTVFQEQLDPFSLVADELSLLADRLRSMVVAEVSNCPKLASAAEYFFKMGVEGKRFRPTHTFCVHGWHNPSLQGDVLAMSLGLFGIQVVGFRLVRSIVPQRKSDFIKFYWIPEKMENI